MSDSPWMIACGGALLGVVAGIQPGALFLMLVRETLRHGFRAGAWVACAPWFTDGPIVLIVLGLLEHAHYPWLLPSLSVAGGCWLSYEGWKTWRDAGKQDWETGKPRAHAESLWSGIRTNWLNPYPWVFWSAVAGPRMLAGGFWKGGLYAISILGSMTVTMLTIAWFLGKGHLLPFLQGKTTGRVIAVAILAFAIWIGTFPLHAE